MKKAILALALLLGALGAAGCQGGGHGVSVEPRAEAAGATTVATASPETGKKKEVHLCGAPTKDGGTCRRRVRREGLRCWMHGGPGAAELDAGGSEKPRNER